MYMELIFAHNVHKRYKPLFHTIETSHKYFPNSKVCVAGDGDDFSHINNDKIKFEKYGPTQGHKVGCVNSPIHSLKMCLEYDFDVVSFSHDDVSIGNIDMVKRDLQMIESGYDFIGRRHIGQRNHTDGYYANKYIMIENYYMTRRMVESVFKDVELFPINENLLPKDAFSYGNSPSCELKFGEILLHEKHIEDYKYYFYDFEHNYPNKENEMGWIHTSEGGGREGQGFTVRVEGE